MIDRPLQVAVATTAARDAYNDDDDDDNNINYVAGRSTWAPLRSLIHVCARVRDTRLVV